MAKYENVLGFLVPEKAVHIIDHTCQTGVFPQVAAAVRLLGKGADRHLRDNERRMATDWAKRFGSTRLHDVLICDPNKVGTVWNAWYAAVYESCINSGMPLVCVVSIVHMYAVSADMRNRNRRGWKALCCVQG